MVAPVVGPVLYRVEPLGGGTEAAVLQLLPALVVYVEVFSAEKVHVTATAFKETFLDVDVRAEQPVHRFTKTLQDSWPWGKSVQGQLQVLRVHEQADMALWGSFCLTLTSGKVQHWDGQLVSIPVPSGPASSATNGPPLAAGGGPAGPSGGAPAPSADGRNRRPPGGRLSAVAVPRSNWGSRVISLDTPETAAELAARVAPDRGGRFEFRGLEQPRPEEPKAIRTLKVINTTGQDIVLEVKLVGRYPIYRRTVSADPSQAPLVIIPWCMPLLLSAASVGRRAAKPLWLTPGCDCKVVQGPYGLKLKAVRKDWLDLAKATASHVLDATQQRGHQWRDFPLRCSVFVRDNAKTGDFVFPELSPTGRFGIKELQAKKNFGVCMSGGGTRAAISSLGVVRGLHHLGVLAKARYLCSTSGGSWFNSAFSFVSVNQNRSLEDFLGPCTIEPGVPYIEPSNLTPEVLSKIGEKGITFASTVQKSGGLSDLLGDLGGSLLGNKWFRADESGGWANWVTKSFLAPFGLGAMKYSTVTALGTNENVHTDIHRISQGWANGLPTVDRREFAVYEYDSLGGQRPFPILMQTVLRPNDLNFFYSKEWTPLYAGVLADKSDKQEHHMGGGYVETIGVNSTVEHGQAPTTDGHGNTSIRLHSRGPASLGGAAGISSSFIPFLSAFGITLTGIFLHLALGGIFQWFWSPAHPEAEPFLTPMADGAGTDNPAITPLLRRKVKKIICWTHTDCDPTDYNSFAANSTVAQFFGAYPGRKYIEGFKDYSGVVSLLTDHPSPEQQNKLRKVFLRKDYDDLWENVRARYAGDPDAGIPGGGPVWHRAKLQVQKNDFEAIDGGWEVEVLFVFNCTCKRFEDQLPEDTKKNLLDKQRWSMFVKLQEGLEKLSQAPWLAVHPVIRTLVSLAFRLVTLVLALFDWIRGQVAHFLVSPATLGDFPLVPTQFLNYSPELVNMLSSQSAWATVFLKDEIDDMLKNA